MHKAELVKNKVFCMISLHTAKPSATCYVRIVRLFHKNLITQERTLY